MILFILVLLSISIGTYATNQNVYPFETMENKKYIIFDITKSKEYLHRLYCSVSPHLTKAAQSYGKDAAIAGEFLLGHCQRDSTACLSALEVILKLQKVVEENNVHESSLITHFIKEDIKKNLTATDLPPMDRLKAWGVQPKEYGYFDPEGWLMPKLAEVLHDTSALLGKENLTKEAGSYFLDAYQKSVGDGDRAYSYMKHLKQLIKNEPQSQETQEYKRCLREWYKNNLSRI